MQDDNSKSDDTTVMPANDDAVVEEKTAEVEKEAVSMDSSSSSSATPAGMDEQGRQLYNVKCSNCGKDTQVPFQPAEGRPVFCRECFMNKNKANG